MLCLPEGFVLFMTELSGSFLFPMFYENLLS